MSIAARFRNYFFAGILVTAPIGITLWLATKAVGFFDDRIRALIPPWWSRESYLPVDLPGFGIVVVLVGLVLAGRLATGVVGALVMKDSERPLRRIPVVRSVYSRMQQIFETLFKEKSTAFREVMLIQYPRPGAWAIGFATGEAGRPIRAGTGAESVNVFLPTTPNPTSGFPRFLPSAEVRTLAMTVEDGLKMVVSGGIVTPGAERGGQAPRHQGEPGGGNR